MRSIFSLPRLRSNHCAQPYPLRVDKCLVYLNGCPMSESSYWKECLLGRMHSEKHKCVRVFVGQLDGTRCRIDIRCVLLSVVLSRTSLSALSLSGML